jgi:hypothetical protein
LRKSKFAKNLSRLKSALHEDPCTFMIISHWILLRMRNVSDRSCIENQTHTLCSITFFFNSCHFLVNVENYGTDRQATGDTIMLYREDAICLLDK